MKSFSHPYPSSGIAGYASDSFSGYDLGRRLLVGCVDARRRREEEAVDAGVLRREQQVRTDEHRDHAIDLVGLDEPHPAHVAREVEDPVDAVDGLAAGIEIAEIELEVLGFGRASGTTRPRACGRRRARGTRRRAATARASRR